MPIYEYKCIECDHRFDFFHKNINEIEDVECPECNGWVERTLSTFSSNIDNPVLDKLRADCQKKSDDFSIKVRSDKAAGKVRSHEPDEKPRKW